MQVDDGVNCFKALTRDSRAVAAGGGLEVSVSRALRDFGTRQAGLQQYSICAFADALEAIPRTLAENSGLDAQVHTRLPCACATDHLIWRTIAEFCGNYMCMLLQSSTVVTLPHVFQYRGAVLRFKYTLPGSPLCTQLREKG